jgi:hypothetical protein
MITEQKAIDKQEMVEHLVILHSAYVLKGGSCEAT